MKVNNNKIDDETKKQAGLTEKKKIDRRQFLESTAKTAGGVTLGAFALRELLHPVCADTAIEAGKIRIDLEKIVGVINKDIYGHLQNT